ncbi:MAG: tRNA pseudouridine(38-40) synthase TruA [Firmicutes bacterium]|nr:tRNA pseudouridine(38-40) synthase TruA [Bacillota bacterium]MCL5038976.1 tRNA pseudouridine(38-40) synthase TruA [Bacillota bacterium]
MRYIKLVLQYDGTAYHGFQRQDPLPTIQSELERALEIIASERIRLVGAGRTDAGVHALGQVVSFRTASRIPTDRLPPALNSLLPPDIVMLEAAEVPPDFHARKSARSKTYRYLVYNWTLPSVFWGRYSHHVKEALSLAAMQEAARRLVGRHDFAAFRAAGSSVKTSERTIWGLEVLAQPLPREAGPWAGYPWNEARFPAVRPAGHGDPDGHEEPPGQKKLDDCDKRVGNEEPCGQTYSSAPVHSPAVSDDAGLAETTSPALSIAPIPQLLHFIVRADGFLYNMVRIVVGTLLDVGRGRLQPEDMEDILQSRDRSRAGATVPAQGLFLERVDYRE